MGGVIYREATPENLLFLPLGASLFYARLHRFYATLPTLLLPLHNGKAHCKQEQTSTLNSWEGKFQPYYTQTWSHVQPRTCALRKEKVVGLGIYDLGSSPVSMHISQKFLRHRILL